jgi:hypothetical protein
MPIKEQRKAGRKADNIISMLSILAGVFLICNNGYLLYAYNFTNKLWLIMYPLYYLIFNIVIGIMLCFSGCILLFKSHKAPMVYRFTALLIMLFAIDLFLKHLVNSVYGILEPLFCVTIFLSGLILFVYFSVKKFAISNKKKIGLLISYAILAAVLIELIFLVIWNDY